MHVCVCVCVYPGVWEETRPLLPFPCVGEGQLGWGLAGTVVALPTLAGQVTLGEPGAWLPACRGMVVVSAVLHLLGILAGRSKGNTWVQGCMHAYWGVVF